MKRYYKHFEQTLIEGQKYMQSNVHGRYSSVFIVDIEKIFADRVVVILQIDISKSQN